MILIKKIWKQSRRHQAGFSIIEIFIAMGVLLITSLAITTFLQGDLKQIRNQQEWDRLHRLKQYLVENVSCGKTLGVYYTDNNDGTAPGGNDERCPSGGDLPMNIYFYSNTGGPHIPTAGSEILGYDLQARCDHDAFKDGSTNIGYPFKIDFYYRRAGTTDAFKLLEFPFPILCEFRADQLTVLRNLP